MDFNIKKPSHILALLLLLISLFLIIVLPILSFIGIFPTIQSTEFPELSESLKLMSEITFLIFQLILVIFLLIIIPMLWYILVNNCTSKDFLSRVKLKLENIDMAFLWGVLAAISIFVIFFAISLLLIRLGAESQDLSNIPDLEKLFSPGTLLILVATQPVAEEIFFRGFLMEKIDTFAGRNVAIFSTAVLFGLAHMAYGKIYPVIFPIIMGVLLGYIVFKTKNLYSAIFAHICFNLIVLIIYLFARPLL